MSFGKEVNNDCGAVVYKLKNGGSNINACNTLTHLADVMANKKAIFMTFLISQFLKGSDGYFARALSTVLKSHVAAIIFFCGLGFFAAPIKLIAI